MPGKAIAGWATYHRSAMTSRLMLSWQNTDRPFAFASPRFLRINRFPDLPSVQR